METLEKIISITQSKTKMYKGLTVSFMDVVKRGNLSFSNMNENRLMG